MYQPVHFREDDRSIQHALIRAHPLGWLVTLGSTGLTANAVPFVLDAGGGKCGTLRCHVARANPVWKDFDVNVEALAIFQGIERYITPSWYVTKQETGKVVPTWNYVAVHAYGVLKVHDDRDWLARNVAELTGMQEQTRSKPWAVSDAPDEFIAAQLRGIVGLEIEITRLEGKWKVSQNRSAADVEGVIDGLKTEGEAGAEAMAAMVAARRR